MLSAPKLQRFLRFAIAIPILSGIVSRDAARLPQCYCAMEFLVSQHGQLGAIPPPAFLSASPLDSMRSGGAIPPPPQKGYLSDTCTIPYENKARSVRNPPLGYYLERVLHDMGGISNWAAKCPSTLAALYRAIRLRFGYRFEVCSANAPRNVKNTNLGKQRSIYFPTSHCS